MQLTIDHAIENLYDLRTATKDTQLKASLSMGISALMTIKDGNYKLDTSTNSPIMNNQNIPALDLKTLYEQITMYADHLSTANQFFHIETYNYPNTPINANIVWNTNDTSIKEITFYVKENK